MGSDKIWSIHQTCHGIQEVLEESVRVMVSPLNRAQRLDAVAKYVRANLDIVGNTGPRMLNADETARRRQELTTLADNLDLLAKAAQQGTAKYEQFEAILARLRRLGAAPAQELTSQVARAFHQ